jgi:hypothetical protein
MATSSTWLLNSRVIQLGAHQGGSECSEDTRIRHWQDPVSGYYVTGLASWEHIRAVWNAVKIPVFANGNIQYPAIIF